MIRFSDNEDRLDRHGHKWNRLTTTFALVVAYTRTTHFLGVGGLFLYILYSDL